MATSEPPTERTVWLHVHVPKAGGSTLRQLFHRTFDKGYYNSVSLLETKQYTREDVSEIVRCHPWVTCMSDHKLSLDLPYVHPAATVMAVAFVRDPVERFISRYFFHRHFQEVSCIAQTTAFREFAEEELIRRNVHPQTNSQIYFLNGGRSETDLTVIHAALATQQAFLFPIERFDESCVGLERLYPATFKDLSYVKVNVTERMHEIEPDERELIGEYLERDWPVMNLAHQCLDACLDTLFPTEGERVQAIAEFRDRCARRYDNFQPLRPASNSAPIKQVTHSG